MRRLVGQNVEADKLLAMVRDAVLDPPTDPPGISYYRLVTEYAARCGRLPQKDAKQRQPHTKNRKRLRDQELPASSVQVECRGLEPLTPTLPAWCAPNCASTPCSV